MEMEMERERERVMGMGAGAGGDPPPTQGCERARISLIFVENYGVGVR